MDTSGNVPIGNCVQAFKPYIALQLARPETGYPHLPESFPERHSFKRTNDRIGAGVHGKVRLREPAYIVWLHEDIDRKHMHIVSVRINEKGEKIDHNREAIRAQNICRDMEVKYGFIPHSENTVKGNYYPCKKVDYPKGDSESAGEAYCPYCYWNVTIAIRLPNTTPF